MSFEQEPKRSRFTDAPPSAPIPSPSSVPADVTSTARPSKKVKKKIYPSVAQYPSVDFKALLEPDRERIERDANVVISIRGKGSGFSPADDEGKDPLHILIEADSEDHSHKAERLVRDVITDPAKLPPPVQTQMVVRQSIFGPRVPREQRESQFSSQPRSDAYKEIRIPEEAAGAIIGKGGETVKRMQADTNTRVFINRDAPTHSDQTRTIEIRGPNQDCVDRCERLILDFVASRRGDRVVASAPAMNYPTSGSSSPPPQFSTSPSPPYSSNDPSSYTPATSAYHSYPPQQQVTEYHTIPNGKAGAVIGRGGATVKAIQTKYRAKVTVPPSADANNPGMRTISIIAGGPEVVDAIRREIDAIIEASNHKQLDDPYGAGGLSSSSQGSMGGGTPVRIPDDKAGLIIGKQGSTIKALQERFQVRIQIPQHAEEGSVPPQRIAVISGRPEMVSLAIQEIDAIVTGLVYTNQVVGGGAPTTTTDVSYSSSTTSAPYHQSGGGGAAAAQASADYAKQWEDYYEQLKQLPPDQQQKALEALADYQKQFAQ